MTSLRLSHRDWFLLSVLAVALYLRAASLGFGLPAMNDPDELMFELGALHMLRGHTLDPGWFGHPATTTMYVLALIDAAVFAVALATGRATSVRQFGDMVYADPSWIVVPGRVAMVCFAIATIWLTWSLAKHFFGSAAGLVAALLLALNPVHITWSQIIRSDGMACVFMLLCLHSCAAIARGARPRDYRFAAAWLGLAIATKWPFALTGLAIGAATLCAICSGAVTPRTGLVRLAVSLLAAVGVLFIVSPYLLIDYPTVLKNLRGEGQAHHLGANGGSFWFNLGWYLGGPVYTGFGVIGLALLAFGTMQLPRERWAALILLPVTFAFLVLFCTQRLIWERWALPLMPLGAIIAAFGFVRLVAVLRARRARWRQWVAAAVLVAAAVPLGARALADGRARMNDTRQLSSIWAERYIPPGSRVLIEHNAFDLLRQPWQLLFPMGRAGCVDLLALVHGRASYAVIELARGGLSNVDYGTMARSRWADCRADFAILTQYDRYGAERGLFPTEYGAYRALLASGSIVATFRPVTGRVGGPVVRIVDLRPVRSRAAREPVNAASYR